MKRFSTIVGLMLMFASAGLRADEPGTLFVHLGGAPGIEAIAGQLIDAAVADPNLGRSFKDSNLKRVKQHLAEQFCKLSGGGCAYTGDDMREVHAGHDISEAEFYGLVDLLSRIMQARGIALTDRNRLLALLAPMKRDIVRVPAGNH